MPSEQTWIAMNCGYIWLCHGICTAEPLCLSRQIVRLSFQLSVACRKTDKTTLAHVSRSSRTKTTFGWAGRSMNKHSNLAVQWRTEQCCWPRLTVWGFITRGNFGTSHGYKWMWSPPPLPWPAYVYLWRGYIDQHAMQRWWLGYTMRPQFSEFNWSAALKITK